MADRRPPCTRSVIAMFRSVSARPCTSRTLSKSWKALVKSGVAESKRCWNISTEASS